MKLHSIKRIFLTLTILVSLPNFAQILNIESLRKIGKETVWSGNTNLNVQLIENKNSFVLVSNRTRLQYKKDKSLFMLINDYNLKESNSNKIVSKGIQHLRYNYKWTEKVRAEVFVQNQFDEISKIRYRRLFGFGPRFKLNKNDDYRFYLGTLVMAEWEKIRSDVESSDFRDYRLSMYFSFSLFPKEGLSIVSTTYMQPRIDEPKDFRFSNDTKVIFKIFKNVAFNIQYSITHDRYPALGIPRTQYKLTNGIIYTFG
ncbi:MAG: DUF481 domain-containing protein [Flavobacteriales bacterium]